MRVAIYVEEGVSQVVLTPESNGEKAMLKVLEDQAQVEIKRGHFYECVGGWVRTSNQTTAESVMLVCRKPEVRR